MTTLVVVRKGETAAMAADSLVTFGETRLSRTNEANQKILQSVDSTGLPGLIGLAGTTAHFPVMRNVLEELRQAGELKLASRDDVFASFIKVHALLKERYFLNTKEDDADPYESSQIVALLANPSGIYGVYSYREVFAFERFWAIGSGRAFALGAMHTVYGKARQASQIARAGVDAGIEFDKSSAGPVTMAEVRLE